jgi:hypothetical protein
VLSWCKRPDAPQDRRAWLPVARESNTGLNRTGSRCMTRPSGSSDRNAESTTPRNSGYAKQVLRKGKQRTEWVAMRKGVAYLFRYREVSLQANSRYLDALAAVDDPTIDVFLFIFLDNTRQWVVLLPPYCSNSLESRPRPRRGQRRHTPAVHRSAKPHSRLRSLRADLHRYATVNQSTMAVPRIPCDFPLTKTPMWPPGSGSSV